MMFDNKSDAKVSGGIIDTCTKIENGNTSGPIDPMTIFSEEEVKQKNEDYKNFEKALRFGCPELCNRLVAIYKKNGLEGLNDLNTLFKNLYHIARIIDGSMEVDFDGCNTKEECIVALLTGKVTIDWDGIYNGKDGWEEIDYTGTK